MAINKTCRVRTNKNRRPLDVGNSSKATERNVLSQMVPERLRHEAFHSLRIFDWTRRDRVHADSISPPLHREVARQRINTSLRRRYVKLHRRPQIMKRRTDVQNLSAILFELRKRRAANVEGAFEIDVNYSSKSIRRQLLSRAEKVAGSSVHNNIDLAELFDSLGDSFL